MRTYAALDQYLGRKMDRPSRSGKHTRIQRRDDGAIAVRYHETDVVTHWPDGTVLLDTGGWKTATTKARMAEYSPLAPYQNRGVWYLGDWRTPNPPAMQRRATIYPDGRVESDGGNPRAVLRLRRQVYAYARKFVAALEAGEVPAPSGSDCWACLGLLPSDDHLRDHLRESYFVPSLLKKALDTIPSSMAMKGYVEGCWNGDADLKRWGDDLLQQSVRETLARYILQQLGEAY